MRLRGSAVSLSRESHKAQRRLDKLQNARRKGIQAAAPRPEPVQPEPKIEKALDLIDATRTVASLAKTQGVTWTQAYQQRQRDARLAARLKRAEACAIAPSKTAAPGASPVDQAPAPAV